MTNEPDDEEDFVAITKDLIKRKITFVLEHYPKLSPSMLQVGIGTGISPQFWRNILSEMIENNEVRLDTFTTRFPNGRDQTLKILSLVQKNADSNASDA